MSIQHRPPLPDILRSTELHDFGDAFKSLRRPGRTLMAVLALAGLIALGQVITDGSAEVAGGVVAVATGLDRS